MITHHIMIIDDSAAHRYGLRLPLQAEGFKVSDAANGVDALDAIKLITEPLSLIITDQNMPKMSGLDLLRILRAMTDSPHAQTPVLVITSETSVEFEEACAKLNVLGIITKPARIEGIIKIVKKSLKMT